MPPVIEIYNTAGAVQASTAAHTFVFVGKGSINVTDHWTGTPYAINSQKIGTYGSVVTPYDFDLVFFRCTDAFFLPANRPYEGEDPRTIRVFTQECYNGFTGIYRYPFDYKTGLASHRVDYWCFRSIRHFAPTNGWGVWLFNPETGELCFDSGRPTADVVHYRRTFGDASTAAAGTAETLIDPANTALMKFQTTALAAVSGVSPNYRTTWWNEAVKNTGTGYSRKHFSAFFQHKTAITGAAQGSTIGLGGIIGIDVSQF